MKKIFLLLTVGIWVSITTVAQTTLQNDKLRRSFAGGGLFLAPHGYQYPDISFDGLISLSNNPGLIGEHLSKHNPTRGEYSLVMTGATLGAYARWFPRHTRFRGAQELRVGVGLVIGREGIVEYYWDDPTGNPEDYSYRQGRSFVDYCYMENELQLSASYLFHARPEKRFQLYGGPGTNVSTGFNTLLFVLSTSEQNLEMSEIRAKNSLYTKFFGHGGMSYRFGRYVALTLETQVGAGWQWLSGGETNFLNNYYSVIGGLQFQF
ncbi:MAG: hypothetical protein AAF632_13085 [Bacteroidota bacterium]